MRKVSKLVVLIIFTFSTHIVFAQDDDDKKEGYKLNFVTISSGENPISSGITGILQFTNTENHRLVELAVQQEQAWFIFGREFNFGKNINGSLGGTVGHFQGAPWIAPRLGLSADIGTLLGQNVSVSTLQWPGLQFWEPRDWKNDDRPNTEPVALGYLGSVTLNIGPWGFTYSAQNFLNDPWNELPGVSYTGNIRSDFSVTGSTTWNNNAQEWMFYIGGTWKPKRD